MIERYFPFLDFAQITVEDFQRYLLKAQWLEKREFENISNVITKPIVKTIVEVAKKMTRKR